MAGKMIGYADATGLGAGWKPRLTKAYMEGRADWYGTTTTSPHQANSPADLAYDHGYANRADAGYKRECAS